MRHTNNLIFSFQVERIVAALPNITEDDVKSVGAGFGSALLSKSNSKLEFPNLDDLLLRLIASDIQ